MAASMAPSTAPGLAKWVLGGLLDAETPLADLQPQPTQTVVLR